MRFAFRQLLKSPGFTVVALLTLALGVGVNTTAFTVLNRLLFHPLPFLEPSRLVQIWATRSQQQSARNHSPADYIDEKEQSTVFERMGVFAPYDNASLADPGQLPVLANGIAVDADFFPTMGIGSSLGRRFTSEDQTYEAAAHTQYIML